MAKTLLNKILHNINTMATYYCIAYNDETDNRQK